MDPTFVRETDEVRALVSALLPNGPGKAAVVGFLLDGQTHANQIFGAWLYGDHVRTTGSSAVSRVALALWKVGRLKDLRFLPTPYVSTEPDPEDCVAPDTHALDEHRILGWRGFWANVASPRFKTRERAVAWVRLRITKDPS